MVNARSSIRISKVFILATDLYLLLENKPLMRLLQDESDLFHQMNLRLNYLHPIQPGYFHVRRAPEQLFQNWNANHMQYDRETYAHRALQCFYFGLPLPNKRQNLAGPGMLTDPGMDQPQVFPLARSRIRTKKSNRIYGSTQQQ